MVIERLDFPSYVLLSYLWLNITTINANGKINKKPSLNVLKFEFLLKGSCKAFERLFSIAPPVNQPEDTTDWLLQLANRTRPWAFVSMVTGDPDGLPQRQPADANWGPRYPGNQSERRGGVLQGGGRGRVSPGRGVERTRWVHQNRKSEPDIRTKV